MKSGWGRVMMEQLCFRVRLLEQKQSSAHRVWSATCRTSGSSCNYGIFSMTISILVVCRRTTSLKLLVRFESYPFCMKVWILCLFFLFRDHKAVYCLREIHTILSRSQQNKGDTRGAIQPSWVSVYVNCTMCSLHGIEEHCETVYIYTVTTIFMES